MFDKVIGGCPEFAISLLVAPIAGVICSFGLWLIPGQIFAYAMFIHYQFNRLMPALAEVYTLEDSLDVPAWINECLEDGTKIDLDWL